MTLKSYTFKFTLTGVKTNEFQSAMEKMVIDIKVENTNSQFFLH